VSNDDLPKIGAPATRALASIGVTRLNQLVDHSEDELLALHGFGPRALRILKEALNHGWTLPALVAGEAFVRLLAVPCRSTRTQRHVRTFS